MLTLESFFCNDVDDIPDEIDVRRNVESKSEKAKCKQEISSSSYERLYVLTLFMSFILIVVFGGLSDLSSMSCLQCVLERERRMITGITFADFKGYKLVKRTSFN